MILFPAFTLFSFDCLQYAKMEKERPGPFYHMNDVSVYSCKQRVGLGGGGGRQGGGGGGEGEGQEQYVLLCEQSKLQHLRQKLQGKASSSFFRSNWNCAFLILCEKKLIEDSWGHLTVGLVSIG